MSLSQWGPFHGPIKSLDLNFRKLPFSHISDSVDKGCAFSAMLKKFYSYISRLYGREFYTVVKMKIERNED